ncbi:MAG TPA: ABC transporter ATP-binding protein [Roseiflexaceae bacterium]|jgi:ATP-binding cassette subfamily B protein|nr:ABC transporter ATP-binding protein [Roseiflexaceae bacterium]
MAFQRSGGMQRGAGTMGPPPKTDGKALRRAMKYGVAYKKEALGAFVSLLLVSAANLAAPQMIRLAIDEGLTNRDINTIVLAVGGLILIAIVRGVFTFLQGYLAERASQGVAYDMRDALFQQIQRLSFSYYDRVQTGQLLTRLTNDVEQIRTFVGTGVIQLVASVVMLIGTAVLLFSMNWRLTLVALLIIPAITLTLLQFVRKIGPLFGQVQQALGRLNSVLQEDLAGLRVIRAFSREDHEIARYHAVNQELFEKNVLTVRTFSNNFPFVFLFANLGTFAVIWYGGLQVIGNQLTVGELIAFNSYLAFLLFPILTIGFLSSGIPRADASAIRVFEVLDAPLDVQDAPDAAPLPMVHGKVEFHDVHFRYTENDREILRGISFAAQPGQTVAILGTTGSGKSTLINLIPRFYDVSAGSVTIDDHDVRKVTIASLRSKIGIVLQEATLFSGTVRDNIAYGKPDATQGEVERAARAAQAHDFISELPQGYETVIGERGVGLSGGQRQRLAIARALLVNPHLLILDDSTSAVDATTEAAILEALDRLMRDRTRTVFVIAQRISTVRDADLILVLDDGQIVARGTHEELLQNSPIYNEILQSQLIGEAVPDMVTP